MNMPDKYVFEKLTPISNSDLGIYENALNFVFENDDVRNVAISGAYGAGKSSILESYKEKYKDKPELFTPVSVRRLTLGKH